MIFPYRLIDLSHTLDNNIPTWDRSCGFNHEIFSDYADTPGQYKFRVMKLNTCAGAGTHIDAPSHCISGGKFIHELDVNDLCMPCVVIDVSNKMHERYSVMPEDIFAFEASYGIINPGICVLIKTGWEKFWKYPEKYHNQHVFPSVSIAAANLLLQRCVVALGIDTLSSDRPEDGFEVHQAFLGKGLILIENIANLEQLVPVGAFVMALPIKLQEGTEAPVRLIALVEK